jgi:hypothetical protein
MFDEEPPDAKATRQVIQSRVKIRQVEGTIGEVGVVWRVATLAADE